MLIKAGVDISRLNREIRRALGEIATIFQRYGVEIVVTSTYEGTHSAGSLHYANDAVDIRYPDPRQEDTVRYIKDILGDDFDVVAERDHIHIEYDPKSSRGVE